MKKIYLFFSMLFGLLGITTASAQNNSEWADEWKTKSVTVDVALADFEPNTWYFFYQGRPANGGSGDYTPPAPGEYTASGGFLADNGIGNNIIKKDVGNVPSESPANRVAEYLVRFVPTENEGAFLIQFGTGNYMTGPAGSGNSQTFKTTDNKYDAGEFNIYNIDPDDCGYIGFNVYNMGARIDNNGTGYTVVTWESGQQTVKSGSNSVWTIFDIAWGELDELATLWDEVAELWADYDTELRGFKDNVGTAPGQYGAEAVDAFSQALDDTEKINDFSWEPESIEELQAIKQKLTEAYQAVLDSKVQYTLADGYYHIRAAMVYTNSVPTGEVDGENNPITESREVLKYMYSTTNSNGQIVARWQTPKDLASDAPSLWKISNTEGGRVRIINADTEAGFVEVNRSSAVIMSTENPGEIVVTPAGTNDDGLILVNLNVYPQNAGEGRYLHQDKHSSGSGVSGDIVGWYNLDNGSYIPASQWIFEAVSDDEAAAIIAAYAPVKQKEQFIAAYKAMKAEAQAAIEAARDVQVVKLITENSQFSSPWTEPSEGSLNNLLDGDNTTFWHSAWSNGNVDAHVHYLQVALKEPVHELISYSFSRRSGAANDHTTQWSIYGSDDPDADNDSWEELMTWNTPFGSNTESFTSEPFDTKGHQYLRIYADATTNNRGYWHVSEVQFSYQQENPNSQYSSMGDIAVNLDNILAEQADIADDAITQEVFDALKTAYDAFKDAFVDPAELRDVLAEVKDKPAIVKVGTAPGFWKDSSTAEALQKTIDEATAYDKAGVYSAQRSNAYIETLHSQAAAIDEAAIKLQAGKWFRFRFGTVEEFEENEWDKVAGNGTEKIPALFGKFAVIANLETDADGYQTIEETDAEEVSMGHDIHFLAQEDISKADMALFRLVGVGDTAYMIQNKATGMFIKTAGTSGAVSLSVHPSLFKVRAIGYGLNVFSAKSITGEAQSNLHAQVSGNTLVTWDVDYPGSRSGFYIEEVEDVATDYDGTDFNINLQPGSITAFCFPVEISASENVLYGVNSVNVQESGQISLALAKLEKVVPGRPFLAIPGDPENYDADAEETRVAFKHGYAVVAEALSGAIMKGTFSQQQIGNGAIVPEENGFVVTKKSDTTVAANHAWIALEEKFDLEAAAVFEITDEPDGIATALSKVAKSGAIYTIDGRLITTNGNLNSLQHYGKGIYIVNGVKVAVK